MTGLFGFLPGPVGRTLLLVAAFLAWTAYQRERAASDARAECEAEQLRATLTEITRQRDVARKALAAAEERAQQNQQELAELEADHDQNVKDLRERAKLSCDIPDDALRRLRNIR